MCKRPGACHACFQSGAAAGQPLPSDPHVYTLAPPAGEYGQEQRVLPPWYHVFPCKAALFNLARSGGVLRWSVRLWVVQDGGKPRGAAPLRCQAAAT